MSKYLSLPGANGAIASVPDTDTALDLTGSHTIRARIRKADWTPTSGELFIAKWGDSGNWGYHWQLNASGQPYFGWTNNGSTGAGETGSTPSPTMTENVWLWVEWKLVASTRTISMSTHADQATEPTTGWTQVSVSAGGGPTGTLYDSSANLSIGSQADGSYRPTNADISQLVIRNESDTNVFQLDPDNWTSGTTWVTSTGHTVTLEGTATVETEQRLTGGTITTPGDGYVYHTFTQSGTLALGAGETSVDVEYLVVAGGGGGHGFMYGGGGGGGGGEAKTGTALTISSEQTITIGGGGVGGHQETATPSPYPTNGSSSSIGSLVVSTGGGFGGYSDFGGGQAAVGALGTGGGGQGETTGGTGGVATGTGGDGGAANSDSVTANRAGGGGGGAVGNGTSATINPHEPGDGGSGKEWPTSSGTFYGGGGGGGATQGDTASVGGTGGGGTGGYAETYATAGSTNKGGGGGGANGANGGGSFSDGKSGGSGIVIVRYLPPSAALGIPQNLVLDYKDTDQIDMSWDAVATATGYDVRRDGTIIATNVATTSYSDTGLAAATEYTHEVRARKV